MSLKAEVKVVHPEGGCQCAWTGLQDGDLGCTWPQPLGAFSNARAYPNRNAGGYTIFDTVLEITKSGLLMGLVDTIDWPGSEADYPLENDDLAPSDDSCMGGGWARGLRLNR